MINLLFQSDKYKFVLEFALKLVYQKPSLLNDILFNISQKYLFSDYSKTDEFYLQHMLIDVLNNQHNHSRTILFFLHIHLRKGLPIYNCLVQQYLNSLQHRNSHSCEHIHRL